MTTNAKWEHFEHGADIGVRGVAPTLEAAIEQTACAMTAVITHLDRVEVKQSVSIHCSAPDNELLLVDWLNALIYEMATRQMLFSQFEVDIEDHRLSATIGGETVDVARHRPVVEVKGATYTALAVRQLADGQWCAQCVVDV